MASHRTKSERSAMRVCMYICMYVCMYARMCMYIQGVKFGFQVNGMKGTTIIFKGEHCHFALTI